MMSESAGHRCARRRMAMIVGDLTVHRMAAVQWCGKPKRLSLSIGAGVLMLKRLVRSLKQFVKHFEVV